MRQASSHMRVETLRAMNGIKKAADEKLYEHVTAGQYHLTDCDCLDQTDQNDQKIL